MKSRLRLSNRNILRLPLFDQVVINGDISGWQQFIEPQAGSIYYEHPKTKVVIYATPDWDKADYTPFIVLMDENDNGAIHAGSYRIKTYAQYVERFNKIAENFI